MNISHLLEWVYEKEPIQNGKKIKNFLQNKLQNTYNGMIYKFYSYILKPIDTFL